MGAAKKESVQQRKRVASTKRKKRVVSSEWLKNMLKPKPKEEEREL